MERSEKALDESELLFAVFDASGEMTAKDEAFIRKIAAFAKTKPVIALINKSDIASEKQINVWESALIHAGIEHRLIVSAKSGDGRNRLEELMRKLFPLSGEALEQGMILANARQYAAVTKAAACLKNALQALETLTRDMAGLDLEQALGALCEADGRQVSEQVVNTIFSRFCVGK